MIMNSEPSGALATMRHGQQL